MSNDLIRREVLDDILELYEKHHPRLATNVYEFGVALRQLIKNTPTVEVPENEVNCVLTMFGKCSYNETGCSDCAIKDKIRKALSERPQGKLIPTYRAEEYYGEVFKCSVCGEIEFDCNFCPNCGADMSEGGEEE